MSDISSSEALETLRLWQAKGHPVEVYLTTASLDLVSDARVSNVSSQKIALALSSGSLAVVLGDDAKFGSLNSTGVNGEKLTLHIEIDTGLSTRLLISSTA